MNKTNDKLKAAIDAWPLDDEQRDLILAGVDQIEQHEAEFLAEKLTQALKQSREAVNEIRAAKRASEVIRLAATEQPYSASAEGRDFAALWVDDLKQNVVHSESRKLSLQLAEIAQSAQSRDVQLARRLELLHDVDRHILERSEALEIAASRIEGTIASKRRVAWQLNILNSLGLFVIGATLGPFLWSLLSLATHFFLALLRP